MLDDELASLLNGMPTTIGTLCEALVRLLDGTAGLAGSVRPGWKSVNFRHARGGLICAVFPYEDRVAIYFEHGRQLEDPEGLLQGDHLKKGRFLCLRPGDSIPEAAIVLLVAEAIALRA